MATNEIPMAGYQSRLLNHVDVAQDTMAFHFEGPNGFDFKPGQSVDPRLINPAETDSEGNTRTFSIASATFENQLIFATRMRDMAFKRPLKKVALGRVHLHYSVTMLKTGVIPIPPARDTAGWPELPLDCHNHGNDPIHDNVKGRNWLD